MARKYKINCIIIQLYCENLVLISVISVQKKQTKILYFRQSKKIT